MLNNDKQVLKETLIPGTVEKISGYANVVVMAEFKNVPVVHAIYINDRTEMARFLDDYFGNFGITDVSITEMPNGNLKYRAKIYTD